MRNKFLTKQCIILVDPALENLNIIITFYDFVCLNSCILS